MSKRLIKSYALVLIVVILSVSIFGAVIYRPSISTATYEELTDIWGVGEVIAERVVLYLEENPNAKIEDLEDIEGIGEYRLSLIKRRYRWLK